MSFLLQDYKDWGQYKKAHLHSSLVCAVAVIVLLLFSTHEIVTFCCPPLPPPIEQTAFSLLVCEKKVFAQRERGEIVDKLLPLPAQMVPLSRVYIF